MCGVTDSQREVKQARRKLRVLTGRAVRTEQLVAERTTANTALVREIAERTRMAAALQESEARYRALFEHAP